MLRSNLILILDLSYSSCRMLQYQGRGIEASVGTGTTTVCGTGTAYSTPIVHYSTPIVHYSTLTVHHSRAETRAVARMSPRGIRHWNSPVGSQY